MKRFLSAYLIGILIFASCQNKNTEQTTDDSLAADSSRVATDTASYTQQMPTEEEIIAAEANLDEQTNPGFTDNRDFDYTYEGLINNQIKVKVNIFKINDQQMARVVYLTAKKIINMDAEYPSVGNFVLTEKIAGKATGIWKLESGEEDILEGTWSSPDGKTQMPVKLLMTGGGDFDDFLSKDEIKTGYYEYKDVNEDEESKEEFPLLYSEELDVKNMAGNTIFFDLYIQGPPPGVHIGMINGFATKSGNAYLYKNDEGCEISFSFSGDAVTLSQKGNDISCGFGANIGAFGTLKKTTPKGE